MPSRRDFLLAGATIPARRLLTLSARTSTFIDLRRRPDVVTVETDSGVRTLTSISGDRWENGAIAVTTTPVPHALRLTLAAPRDGIRRVHARWAGNLRAVRLIMGDAWERAYGDLAWQGIAPDRVLPWYALTWDGNATHGYGVRTASAAFVFWRIDRDGISLTADVRSGGAPLRLGDRQLTVCDVVSRQGRAHESPFDAARAFCHILSPSPRLPDHPVFGHNDWYYAYGDNSEATVLADADRIVELSPAGNNRPYVVIDDGWQPERGAGKLPGLWDRGNEKFPDMAALASKIKANGARAGIWLRPLQAPRDAADSWRLARSRATLDPTVDGVLEKMRADIARIHEWGYRLIKHDYSTWDIMGRWGSSMGAALTGDRWTFAEGQQRTTAEVITAFYQAIRSAASDSLVIGCNTVSHLSAGLFEICRIGDDTSGEEWGRVPEMGVNALAFRGSQSGAFYVADPDCVGVTTKIPWAMNRQWLDLLSRSGTTTFVSIAPDALTDQVRNDLRVALARAATPQPLAQPADWMETTWPETWRAAGTTARYDWTGRAGIDG